jgi:V/A-type H+-transporting ATPase subunit K
MYFIIMLMTTTILSLIGLGLYLEFKPLQAVNTKSWFKGSLSINLLVFLGAQGLLIYMGFQEAMASSAVAQVAAGGEISTGMGLAIIGIGIPTAISTLGAAIAVGPIGAASLAALAEKPEMFGRTLIYLGLAEGIAIYGLVLSILLLGKI